MSKFLKETKEVRDTMRKVGHDLGTLANAFQAIGSSEIANTLGHFEDLLLEAAERLTRVVADKVNQDLHDAEQGCRNTLTGVLAGYQAATEGRKVPPGDE